MYERGKMSLPTDLTLHSLADGPCSCCCWLGVPRARNTYIDPIVRSHHVDHQVVLCHPGPQTSSTELEFLPKSAVVRFDQVCSLRDEAKAWVLARQRRA